MRRIGWPKKSGRTDEIRARGMIYGKDGRAWTSEDNPLTASRRGPASQRTDLKEPWASDPDRTGSWHIEGNAIALMVKYRQNEIILYVNQKVCGSEPPFDPKRCHETLPKLMPRGYTLYVHSVLEQGGVHIRKYQGTGEALK
jgi:hypothetical protein